ncbi:MAG: N-acetylmuramoyl-L-alanine amidase family protein [Actinomycetota bacterium]
MQRQRSILAIMLALAFALSACVSTPVRHAPRAQATFVASFPDYGGQSVSWPIFHHPTPAPRAFGAVVTTSRFLLASGGALPAGLTLPRIGGTDQNPTIMTPCGKVATYAGGTFTWIAPASSNRTVVVLDPGHGGQDSGAVAPDGTKEATRVLELAELVRDDLAGSVNAVVLTRTSDADTSLQYRATLGDALRATLSVSIHLNDGADVLNAPHPGTETFGSLADPNGRRAAGVLFVAERQYLDTLTSRIPGGWASDSDAGALYRIGSRGDFYFLLRESHTTWVISEALYITHPPETRLIADPAVRSGLAHAIANGIRAFIASTQPGSGWRNPLPRPDTPGIPIPCTDPVG